MRAAVAEAPVTNGKGRILTIHQDRLSQIVEASATGWGATTERAFSIATEVAEYAAAETAAETPAPKLYQLISDLTAEALPIPNQGLDGIYPHGGLVTLYGPRGIGKTFLGLGWGFGHTVGAWQGRRAVLGPAVHILSEGRGGLGVRVRAQKEYLGLEGEAGVYFIPTAVPMLNVVEVDRLIATIETLAAPPALILWDTLSRTFVGGDENSSKDMAEYVAAVDRVKERVGGTAVVLHHTGHSTERERGSSVLGGAADTIIAMRERDGAIELVCEKQKDAPPFPTIPLTLQAVGASCVVKLHDAPWSNAGFLSIVERQALRSLHDCFLADGATTTAWLKASEMVESSFYKARKSLVERDFVAQKRQGRGARYSITPEGVGMLKLHSSTVTP